MIFFMILARILAETSEITSEVEKMKAGVAEITVVSEGKSLVAGVFGGVESSENSESSDSSESSDTKEQNDDKDPKDEQDKDGADENSDEDKDSAEENNPVKPNDENTPKNNSGTEEPGSPENSSNLANHQLIIGFIVLIALMFFAFVVIIVVILKKKKHQSYELPQMAQASYQRHDQ